MCAFNEFGWTLGVFDAQTLSRTQTIDGKQPLSIPDWPPLTTSSLKKVSLIFRGGYRWRCKMYRDFTTFPLQFNIFVNCKYGSLLCLDHIVVSVTCLLSAAHSRCVCVCVCVSVLLQWLALWFWILCRRGKWMSWTWSYKPRISLHLKYIQTLTSGQTDCSLNKFWKKIFMSFPEEIH